MRAFVKTTLADASSADGKFHLATNKVIHNGGVLTGKSLYYLNDLSKPDNVNSIMCVADISSHSSYMKLNGVS